MKNYTGVLSEKALEELLGQTFLNVNFSEPGNQKMLESVANHCLGTSATGVMGSGKVSVSKMALVPIVLAVAVTTFFLWPSNKNKPKENNFSIAPLAKEKVDSVLIFKKELLVKGDQSRGKPFVDREKPLQGVDTLITSGEVESIGMEEAVSSFTITLPREIKKSDKAPYTFPVLTEKEIKVNEKEKKRIARQAVKLGKDKYYLIPGMEFYMQTTEVTNLEYRTFLFDLLIKGKKDEFLKAKPDQSLWIKSNGTDQFNRNADLYFSDKRFNDYPVVNISPDGAEMYCIWLKELISDKAPGCEVRLPYEKEWKYAAKAGKENATYPWGRDSIQNRHNRFLANCCFQKLQEKFNQPVTYPSSMKTDPSAYTTGGMATGYDTLASVLVSAYNPNDYYLYCMSGNVSEIVYSEGRRTFKAKGGNWASDFEHLKIDSEDEFKIVKASPMIGFRPVIFRHVTK